MNDQTEDRPESEEEELESRSELKRQMKAMQNLAERLMKLKPQQRQDFNFSPVMVAALEETSRIKSHNALRRHGRRVAKLLTNEDATQIQTLFERIDNEHLQDTRRFHRIERWRDRLVTEGDSVLGELLDACPGADRTHLRQLIRASRKEIEKGKPPASQRKIFKYLKTLDLE
ncbi:MAG: DUF615 domain-containing protein [Gammaproteobacteria bacterium]|nr:DUF615 domain-containing protein [Gammaproteobacteria bacterium]